MKKEWFGEKENRVDEQAHVRFHKSLIGIKLFSKLQMQASCEIIGAVVAAFLQQAWFESNIISRYERMSRQWRVLVGIAAILSGQSITASLLAADTNAPPFQPKLPDYSLWPQGRYVYQRNCLICHGAFGDGRGDLGRELKPPPRNFKHGIFKYHSTPASALPTDADLERTIRGGLSGTAMPVFSNLSDREIKSVIEYLKNFSPRWRNPTNYAPALILPPLPIWFENEALLKSHAEKARSLFNTACTACHGVDGSGREATVKNLKDSWGEPVTPTDLRQPVLRSGPTPQAVYRVLLTGIDGTPMPSFAEAISEEQRWELAAFISQLRKSDAKTGTP